MKKSPFFRIALLPCLLLIGASLTSAEDIKKIQPSGYVTDLAGVIATDTKARLESLCTEVEQKTGAQMAIVTVASLDGESVENYAVNLYKELGVGKKTIAACCSWSHPTSANIVSKSATASSRSSTMREPAMPAAPWCRSFGKVTTARPRKLPPGSWQTTLLAMLALP
jgi:hypothetical protein